MTRAERGGDRSASAAGDVEPSRGRAFRRHLVAVLFLPVTVTVFVPGTILFGVSSGGAKGGMRWPLAWAPLAIGGGLVSVGTVMVVLTARLLARLGRGTLAPWDPTRELVVAGMYRHVRNPMIIGVCCTLLGEAIALGSLRLWLWFAGFVVANAIYVPLVEETGLEARFGESYRRYRSNVRRWLPRLKAWEG